MQKQATKTKTMASTPKASASTPKASASTPKASASTPKASASTPKVARVPAGPVASMADTIAANTKNRPFAGLLLASLSGEFGPSAQRFYKSALSYHGKRGTTFPRQPMGSIEPKEAADYIRGGPVAGNGFSQRIFDRMVVEAFGGAK